MTAQRHNRLHREILADRCGQSWNNGTLGHNVIGKIYVANGREHHPQSNSRSDSASRESVHPYRARTGQKIQRGGDLEVHPKCNCRFHGSHPPQSTSRCFSSIDPLLFRQRYSLRNKDPRTAGSAFSSSLLSFQSWFPIHSNQMLAATKAIRISATSVVRSVAFRCNGRFAVIHIGSRPSACPHCD